MTAWKKVRRNLDPINRSKLDAVAVKLAAAPGGRHVISNIKADHFISTRIMKEIVNLFCKLHRRRVDHILQQYDQLCIDYKLQGGVVPISHKPKKLGRAIEKSPWVSVISDPLLNMDFAKSEAKQFVDRFIRNRLRTSDRMAMPRLRMSPYAAWVTWNLDSVGNQHPFSGLKKNSDSVRASLGLNQRYFGKPILILEYQNHAISELHRPTIADAGLHLRFQPPDENVKEHGLTRPWEDWPGTKNLIAKPLPEALHKSQTMDCLKTITLYSASVL